MTPTPTSQPQCQCDSRFPKSPAIIVAVAHDGAIGRGGDQPFYIKEDLRHFKELTKGHTIIMGRKTFEALPKGALPGRRNIVVTRQIGFTAPNVETASSLDAAITMAATQGENPEVDTYTFIIGGGEIYRHSMTLAKSLYVTEIDADVADVDTFFPQIPAAEWRICEISEWLDTTPRCRFICYCRK